MSKYETIIKAINNRLQNPMTAPAARHCLTGLMIEIGERNGLSVSRPNEASSSSTKTEANGEAAACKEGYHISR